ncbi:hypothetical protein Ahu01nite_034500 [Winogradskya humida]|uniref:HTH marR-type domain-containing protein n=2 Tax=Winogradskya humida TaxID=113566 RepID=A0ABQ3ZPC4_9ACTN|nr:hypothetical protein Ahu01nite_034500 [Actinoplanes humidus]
MYVTPIPQEALMPDDAGTAARRELLHQVREMFTAFRLFKGELPSQHAAVPPGTLMVLASIDQMTPGSDAGCHLKDLAVRCSLDPSTVSRSVAALVRSGLVDRAADPVDGRASVLALSAHGRRTLDEIYGWIDDRLAVAMQGWALDDIAVFTALMQRFSSDLTLKTLNPLEAAR